MGLTSHLDLLLALINLVDECCAGEVSSDGDSVAVGAGEVAMHRCGETERFAAGVGHGGGAAQLQKYTHVHHCFG